MNVKTLLLSFLYFIPLVYGKPQNVPLRVGAALGHLGIGNQLGSLGCFGSIEFLFSTEEEPNQTWIITSEQLVYRNNRIFRIKAQDKTPEFSYARVNGNCCWDVYPRPRFLGSKSTMGPSEEKQLGFNPRSLKVKNCWVERIKKCPDFRFL